MAQEQAEVSSLTDVYQWKMRFWRYRPVILALTFFSIFPHPNYFDRSLPFLCVCAHINRSALYIFQRNLWQQINSLPLPGLAVGKYSSTNSRHCPLL
jgi:hypothetical protein